MASACVNNSGMSSEKFSPANYPPHRCLSPRVSLSREDVEHRTADALEIEDAGDFEFRLEDPVAMLPADELFSDGKLVPLKLSSSKQPISDLTGMERSSRQLEGKPYRSLLEMEIPGVDPYLFSPKAPRCTTRWRELLGLKKLSSQNAKSSDKTTPSAHSTLPSYQNKQFLHRSSKSTSSASSKASSSLNFRLLKDLDTSESLSMCSSRLSLSSSSSSGGHEIDIDLPRLSLDSDKPGPNPFAPARRMRMMKRQPAVGEPPGTAEGREVSADSPRLNSSGKIVFHGLGRSSSSPGSFNGGPRLKHRGMERSYSANVRVTPVLNVPMCSLRGSSKSGLFGQLFSSSSSLSSSPHKNGTRGSNRGHSQSSGKNRTENGKIAKI